MRDTVFETIIGALVIAIATGFFAYAYMGSGRAHNYDGYHVRAEFDSVDGINIGSDVRLAGIKIGAVIDQSLNYENYQAALTLAINRQVKLTEDVTAKVTAEGLLGAKFISLEQGGAEGFLNDGGTINYTQGAVDLWSLISQAMFQKPASKPENPPPAPPTPSPPAQPVTP